MANRVDEIEEIEDSLAAQWAAVQKALEANSAQEVRSDAETVEKTNRIGPGIVSDVEVPSATDPKIRLSDPKVELENTAHRDPKLLLEVVHTVIARGELYDSQINACIARAEKLDDQIAKITELNKLLAGSKEDESLDNVKKQKPRIQELLTELNIDLPNNTTVGNARIHFDALTTTNRSKLSALFTTEMQPMLQNKQALYDIMKEIQRRHDRFIEYIISPNK